jgi:ABC-2 type transport system permease protein
MKQFFAFIRKEFYHVFRDRKTLLMLFGLPIVQIVLFGFALSNEVKNSRIVVVDHAHDRVSQELSARLEANRYFEIAGVVTTFQEIDQEFKKGSIKAAVVFPEGLMSSLGHDNKSQIQIITDASDPNTATTISNYLTSVIRDYQNDHASGSQPYRLVAETRMFYNPELRGAPNFVPGVMALVLMLVCVMMTSISIVREKESGTMEVLLVSPFSPLLVLVSKAVPYLLISAANLGVILCLSVYALGLPVRGDLALLILVSMMFIVTALTLGLLISTITNSQQTAMLISLMGMMLPTIIFSGFMFPLENMPVALQFISNLIPAKWYYVIVKSVMIKGLGFSYVWKETLILFGMTLFLFLLSVKNFKTRLA